MTPQEVLDRAADILESRGWQPFPGQRLDDTSPLCAVQAIAVAAGVNAFALSTHEGELFNQACATAVGRTGFKGPLYSWNDKQKSVKPVLQVLRGAGA